MEKKRILVVDDEHDLCEILHFNLTTAGYDVTTANSAEEAFECMSDKSFDLLLLDVMMPGLSGFQFAEELRKQERKQGTSPIPIIFLTAKNAEDDMLEGFAAGADDYITKPFSVREVLARIKAVLARSGKTVDTDSLTYQGLTMCHNTKTVTVDGIDVPFTKTEFELLWLMLGHRGKVFSRQELIEEAWPDNVIVTNRTVDVNITRMRKKIGAYAANIITRQGYGYYFKENIEKETQP